MGPRRWAARRRGVAMRIMLAAGVLALAVAVAGLAQGQPRKARPSIEGDWRVNFIVPMEATPQTPQLVVPEKDAKALADTLGAAMAQMFIQGLDPEFPQLVKDSDGLAIVRGQR